MKYEQGAFQKPFRQPFQFTIMSSRFLLFFTVSTLLGNLLMAQTPSRYWVVFKDKGPGAEIRAKYPANFLSPASLHNRAQKGIKPDQTDLPVWEGYIHETSIPGIETRCVSRWLNAVSVETNFTPSEILSKIPDAKAVVPLHQMLPAKNTSTETRKETEILPGTEKASAYGLGEKQVNMMNIPYLHSLGFQCREEFQFLFGFR